MGATECSQYFTVTNPYNTTNNNDTTIHHRHLADATQCVAQQRRLVHRCQS